MDAGIGVYVNILCAALMQLRGSRVIAHHHNYSYIAQPSGLVVIKVLIVVQPTKERELRCRLVLVTSDAEPEREEADVG